jgi:small subunit ribosomal protein S3
MGQKVNPHGLRVGVIKDWDSRWYASEEKVGDLIVEDQKIRKFLKKALYGAGVPKIEIERSSDVVTIPVGASARAASRSSSTVPPLRSSSARR